MGRTRTLRVLATATAGVLVAAVPVTPAVAHPIRAEGWLYKSSDLCTKGAVHLDHRRENSAGGWLNLYTYSRTRSWVPELGWVNCILAYSRPPGNIRTNLNYWKWTGTSWYICLQGGWVTNRYEAPSLLATYRFVLPPCGDGWYVPHGLHGVWNSGWYGGDIYMSDAHWFPDYSTKQEGSPPVPASFPARAPALGRDGQPLVDKNGQQVVLDATPADNTIAPDIGEHRLVTAEDGSVGEQVIFEFN
jgi:hypothetical protein